MITVEKRFILTIVGMSGSGKSTLAKMLIERFLRTVVIDPNIEYTNGVVIENPADFANYVNRHRDSEYHVIFRDTGKYKLSWMHAFKIAAALRDCVVLVDEAWMFDDPNPGAADENLRKLISLGRHNNVSVIIVTQRPQQLGRNTTDQSSKVISFRLNDPASLTWVTRVAGAEMADKVSNLGIHEWEMLQDNYPAPELDELLAETVEGETDGNDSAVPDQQLGEDAGDGGNGVPDPVSESQGENGAGEALRHDRAGDGGGDSAAVPDAAGSGSRGSRHEADRRQVEADAGGGESNRDSGGAAGDGDAPRRGPRGQFARK